MKTKITGWHLFSLAVFLLGVSLRLGLSLVNREANDRHIQVMRLILRTHRLPTKEKCFECFQPKLFHYSIARVVSSLEQAGFHTDPDGQIVIAQLVNFLAGLATLVCVWVFIQELPIQNQKLKQFAFALVVLNPKLIGINSQVTNDTFLILFSTLAIYCAFHFLKTQSFWILLFATLFTVLAISSKTNGWATALAILLAILATSWIKQGGRLRTAAFAVIYLISVVVLTILNPLSQYLTNFRAYGSPILASIGERRPFPNLFTKTYYSNSGIVSIQDGFFTFKFVELLKQPVIDGHDWSEQPYRTSFWTLLYGQAHSVHFDNWPPSWSATSDGIISLSRAIFSLALLPTALIIFGMVAQIIVVFTGISRADLALMQQSSFGLFLLASGGYVGFVVIYSLLDRGYPVIKAIFILPALVSFVLFFLTGYERLDLLLSKGRHGRIFLADFILVTLLLFYVMDVYSLIVQLYFYNILALS